MKQHYIYCRQAQQNERHNLNLNAHFSGIEFTSYLLLNLIFFLIDTFDQPKNQKFKFDEIKTILWELLSALSLQRGMGW